MLNLPDKSVVKRFANVDAQRRRRLEKKKEKEEKNI
jgi:hypothetical protein